MMIEFLAHLQPMKRKNLFIAFEGIDGSGKSTQAKLLAERLSSEGHKVHLTAEPTTGPIGRMIREAFSGKQAFDHRVIAGLFVADRLHHILNQEDGMLKLLANGYTVICDRYLLSSYAYQGVHMPMEWVIAANQQSAELLRPDLNVFIDVKPDVSMNRIQGSRDNIELYETLENLQAVRNQYLKAFQIVNSTQNIEIFDGNKSPEELHNEIFRHVKLLMSP
jgi:dTMP kinase